MREQPEKPIFGPESPKLDPPNPPEIKPWRSLAKAFSWRAVGTLDTLILSYVLITYLGPLVGMDPEASNAEILETASYIALAEVATKLVLYYLHERFWVKLGWGVTMEDGKRRDTHKRTATKTTTWRVLASLDTILLAFIFTGNIATAISIGGFEVITKLFLYYFHERVWARLPFGIVHEADDQAQEKE